MAGGASIGSLVLSLVADTKGLDKAQAEVTKLGKTVQDTTGKIGGSFDSMGRKMQYFGWYASMYLTAPITLFGTAAFTAAKDFEWSMNKIVGLVGESRDQVNAWSKDILQLGQGFGAQPKKLAEAMYFITSSGFTGAKAMDILEQSTKAAATGLGDINKIADFTTSALNAYAQSGLTAGEVMDVLTAAVREGKIEATGFTNTIGQVIPVASEMGVRFDELAAAIASMSLTGTNASQGVVYLRGILNAILDPASEAGKALEEMGLSGEGLRKTIREQGLLVALKQINDRTKDYGQTLVSKVIPNVRAMTGFMSLMGENYEHNLQIFREVSASTGSMDKAFLAVTDTIQFKWNQALATAQASLIKIGTSLKGSIIPLLNAFSKAISGLADWFSNLSPFLQKVITGFLGFLAVLGPLSAGLGFIIRYIIPGIKVGFVELIGIIPKLVVQLTALRLSLVALGQRSLGVMVLRSIVHIKNGLIALRTAIIALNAAGKITAGITTFGVALAGLLVASGLIKLIRYLKEAKRAKEELFDSMMVNPMEKKLAWGGPELDDMKKRMLARSTMSKDELQSLKKDMLKQYKVVYGAWQKQQEFINRTQDWLDKYKGEKGTPIALINLENSKQLSDGLKKQMDTYMSYVRQLNNDIEKIDPPIIHLSEVDEIMKEMLKAEKVIQAMIPIMASLGLEYDSNAKLASLYTGTLEKLAEYLPKSSKELEVVRLKLEAIGKSTKRITQIMDDLQGELVFIEAMGQLGWSKKDMDTASFNAFSQALEKMAKAGVTAGDDIEYIKRGLSDFGKQIMGVIPIMDTLYKELDRINMMTELMGTQFDAPSARISAYTSAIQALHTELQEGNISWMEYATQIKQLVPELNKAMEAQNRFSVQQIVANNMARASVDILETMGQALAGNADAWSNMVTIVLSSAQSIISSLLEQYIATLLLASATMAEKEIAREGIAGLAVAAIGIAGLMALMAGAKSTASGAAKMKDGGVVPAGYPNDSFPALLTSGETVFPKGSLPEDTDKPRIVGKIKLEGKDLYIVLEQYKKHLTRVS